MPLVLDRYVGQSIDVKHISGDTMRIEVAGIIEETGQISILLDADHKFIFSKSKRVPMKDREKKPENFNKQDFNKSKQFPSDY